MKKLISILIIVFLVSASCHREGERIIPKKQLVSMMVDLYICDAIETNTYLRSQLGGIDSTEIYGSFIKKYKYNKKDLDFTLKYYSSKPKKLTMIYDQVFAELSKRGDDFRNVSNKYSYPNLRSVWHNSKNIEISGDTGTYPLTFDIPLDTTGVYMISAQIKLNIQDQSKNPYITAYFFNPDDDKENKRHYFKKTPLFKTNFSREYLVLEKNDDPKLSHIFIKIPDQQNTDSVFFKSLILSNLTVSLILNKPDNEKLK